MTEGARTPPGTAARSGTGPPPRRGAAVRGTPVSPLSEPGCRYVAERLLTTVREEVTRADTKASILLSGAVALPALVVSADRGGLGSGPLGRAGAVLWLAGIVMLTLVILPRSRPDARSGTAAAGRGPSVVALHRGADPGEVAAAVLTAGRDPGHWLLEQSCALGAILTVKYRWLRWAVGCLVVGGTAVAATALG
ncbi:Pycsar system effector family protein [Streptomyces sp. NPDC053474]|uniref:Pycsar system effector family protein n=1 Tax=Streptomyces sp. NPDC053474 TaxID=3365704 RepID=UPI0037CF899F